MTISKETLPFLADGVLYAQKRGYSIEASLAEGVNWSENDALIYKKELEKLAEFYLDNPSFKPLNVLTRYLNVVDPEKDKKKMQKFCGTGTYMTTYDIDGKTYGCHMFSPIVLGEKALEKRNINFKCSEIAYDSVCSKCILKHFCPTCAGFNYRYRGNLGIRDKNKCALHLEEARISSMFQIKLIAQRKSKLSLEDAQHLNQAMNAIDIIEKTVSKNKYPYCL